MPDVHDKILAELQAQTKELAAIRRALTSKEPEPTEPESEHDRVQRKLSGLKSKGG